MLLCQNKVKSNLPRDDINLQFCRGVLKDKRTMLEEMKVSKMTKSLTEQSRREAEKGEEIDNKDMKDEKY